MAWVAFFIVVLGIIVLVAAEMTVGVASDKLAGLVAMLALSLTIGAGLLSRYQNNTAGVLRYAAIWIGIAFICVIIASVYPQIMPV